MDYILEGKPQSLIVYVGTNNFTNDVNLLNNTKKIVNKTKIRKLLYLVFLIDWS